VFYGSTFPASTKVVSGLVDNVDGQDLVWYFSIPLPTNKGSLKLYLTGLTLDLFDADATNYVDFAYFLGLTNSAVATILPDGQSTNRTARGSYEYTLADTDVSSYAQVVANLGTVVADANALDIAAVRASCFYDT
jgi:hypothetical protein